MSYFVDDITVRVSSGRGGDGSASFRREKYVPKGGPDGGDGGRGGSVLFEADEGMESLSHIALRKSYRADDGKAGGSARKHGAAGRDVVIHVPAGTLLWTTDGEQLADLTEHGQRLLLLEGGRGGKGNVHYKSATNQAPRYAQPGEAGRSMELRLELESIADVGLVGFPNAGKSSLLNALTEAEPEIADYAFTTKTPNLGVVHYEDAQLVIADVPGIIEGASRGAGLGFRFLRHIERTTALLFVVDLVSEQPDAQYRALCAELEAYGRGLAEKQRTVVGSKADMRGSDAGVEALRRGAGEAVLHTVSSMSGEGIAELRAALYAVKEPTE